MNNCQDPIYDLIILDVMLPGKNGIEVCQSLRQKKIMVPILFLSGLDEVDDKVEGLKSGGDDYMIKPFSFKELNARVEALLRRTPQAIGPEIKAGSLILNTATKEVWQRDRKIELRNKEFEILEYLMRHPNVIVTRLSLEQHIWNFELDSKSNVLDAHIKNLRAKLDLDDVSVRI